MKLSHLKQIIKEEILREIKVQPPVPLELVKVPGGYELLVGNEYRTNDHSYERLQNYKELPGYVDDNFYVDDEFIKLINPEPSFGGGAPEAEIEDSYSMWEDELRKIQNVFEKYNVKYEYRGDDIFRISVDQIRNWNKIEIIDEIKVQGPISNHFFWINDAIEFFRDDNGIFKGSKIDSIIKENGSTILNDIWESYANAYLDYEAEEGEDYPRSKNELNNPDKYTGGVSDCEYYVLVKFLTPYILNWLKENGWEYDRETYDFVKDGRKVDIFNYINTFVMQDTGPRDSAYEDFYDYMDENF